MMRATDVRHWDVEIPLNGKPSIFTDVLVEFALKHEEDGPKVYATALRFGDVTLEVPYWREVNEKAKAELEKGNTKKAFEILLAHILAEEIEKDEILLEEVA